MTSFPIRRTPRRSSAAARCQGELLATALHVVLLLAVLGQIVYLGSRHRLRVDTTSDDMYSLTDSTRTIVGALDKRLIIEAYLSSKEDQPAQLREMRTVLDNFLDELVQIGRGKVVVQRFNPLEDKVVEDKCRRIGIKPIDARTSSSNALEVKRHWQGLRLVYGGDRQKVIEQIGPRSSFEAEAVVTPAIKEVVTRERRKIGYMEWPSDPPPGQQPPQGIGWSAVRGIDAIAKRYDFQNFRDAEGALVPNEITTLLLFRPKDLSDRQKYVVDQFLMRGGTLVLFADVADYGIAPRRQFNKLPLQLDAKDSQYRWQEQLLGYGIDLPGKLAADMRPEALRVQNPMMGQEYYGLPTQMGIAQQLPYPFPYFFHAVSRAWADDAEQLASPGGRRDDTLVEFFRKTLRPGIDSDEFLFKAFKRLGRGPGFYWPCVVDLRRKNTDPDLPPGVDGRVLLWSSPRTLLEDPPASLDPLGGGDQLQQRAQLEAFETKLKQRIDSEQPRQAPLMVDLQGRFPSFFAGKARPKKASEVKEEEARKKEEEAKAQAAKDAEAAGDAGKQEPSPAPVGPPPPEPKKEPEAPKVVEPEPLQAATAPGRIVAIGDSDFLRDDLLRGDYRNLGGPQSLNGAGFFQLLIDWLSQDSDLVALQSKVPIDRKLDLVRAPVDRVEDARDAEKRVLTRTGLLVNLNVVLPCAVLLGLGLVVFVVRRTQKRQFLASIGD